MGSDLKTDQDMEVTPAFGPQPLVRTLSLLTPTLLTLALGGEEVPVGPPEH